MGYWKSLQSIFHKLSNTPPTKHVNCYSYHMHYNWGNENKKNEKKFSFLDTLIEESLSGFFSNNNDRIKDCSFLSACICVPNDIYEDCIHYLQKYLKQGCPGSYSFNQNVFYTYTANEITYIQGMHNWTDAPPEIDAQAISKKMVDDFPFRLFGEGKHVNEDEFTEMLCAAPALADYFQKYILEEVFHKQQKRLRLVLLFPEAAFDDLCKLLMYQDGVRTKNTLTWIERVVKIMHFSVPINEGETAHLKLDEYNNDINAADTLDLLESIESKIKNDIGLHEKNKLLTLIENKRADLKQNQGKTHTSAR